MPTTAEASVKATNKQASNIPADTAVTRLDPITGQSTIFAPQRDARPDQYQSTDLTQSDTAIGCPFCRGAESQTPAPVWIGRKADHGTIDSEMAAKSMPRSASRAQQAALVRQTSLAHSLCIRDPKELSAAQADDWLVRVVPNKFPAIMQVGDGHFREPKTTHPRRSKLFSESPVAGGHEVIVESPNHEETITALDTSHLALVFAAIRDRMGHWQNVDGIAYISTFKNCGGDAGASLAHSHSQMIATDIMPTHIREILSRTAKYRAKTGCCLQCDLIRAEQKEKQRIVATTDSLVAFCPFASPMPMGVRIAPRDHADRFDLASDEMIESVARLVKRVARWIEKLMPGTAYNFVINTRPPAATGDAESFHWSMDIFPRLSRIAGFEFGSQCMINSVMPEIAAANYRQCSASEDPRGNR
ncbi:DUF4921 family protein [Planctomycetes bacterium K23_9]|uniref:Galactose-1-phosphate uridylyltransferase n=1 Tax=Stieleria marina TaxID=1930275 RepID=A0A517NND6_9BACT|nr:Galactose-1-phosphate uridylyltransferase [Planctomycetes bacterium K23_9]